MRIVKVIINKFLNLKNKKFDTNGKVVLISSKERGGGKTNFLKAIWWCLSPTNQVDKELYSLNENLDVSIDVATDKSVYTLIRRLDLKNSYKTSYFIGEYGRFQEYTRSEYFDFISNCIFYNFFAKTNFYNVESISYNKTFFKSLVDLFKIRFKEKFIDRVFVEKYIKEEFELLTTKYPFPKKPLEVVIEDDYSIELYSGREKYLNGYYSSCDKILLDLCSRIISIKTFETLLKENHLPVFIDDAFSVVDNAISVGLFRLLTRLDNQLFITSYNFVSVETADKIGVVKICL